MIKDFLRYSVGWSEPLATANAHPHLKPRYNYVFYILLSARFIFLGLFAVASKDYTPFRGPLVTSAIMFLILRLFGGTKYYRYALRCQIYIVLAWVMVRVARDISETHIPLGTFGVHSMVLINSVLIACMGLPALEALGIASIGVSVTLVLPLINPAIPEQYISEVLALVITTHCATLGIAFTQRMNEQQTLRQQKELEVARDAALAASQLKSQFVATMSHEVRTPLNGIIGMTGFLGESQLTDEQREYVNNVHTSAEILLALATQVLDYSRADAAHMELKVVEFDLRKVIDDVVQICGTIASKSVDVIGTVEDECPVLCNGDKMRLQQILVNLMTNACKFTHRGCVTLSVGHASEEEIAQHAKPDAPAGARFLRFRISDTGIGMDADQLDRLFQPFTQVDSSSTRRYGGVGLGLYLAKRFAEAMSGDITATSSGQRLGGSTFTCCVALQVSGGVRPRGLSDSTHRVLDGIPVSVIAVKPQCAEFYRDCVSRQAADLVELPGMDHVRNAVQIIDSPDWERHVPTERRNTGALVVILHPSVTEKDVPTHCQIVRKPVRQEKLCAAVEAAYRGIPRNSFASPSVSPIVPLAIPQLGNVSMYSNDESMVDRVHSRNLSTLFDSASAQPGASPLRESSMTMSSPMSSTRTSPQRSSIVAQMNDSLNYEAPHVLVAEDNMINQAVIKRMLHKLGCNVTIVDNGAKAVQALMKQPELYSAVFLDLHMPILDGLAAARAIRSHEETAMRPRMPLIALTADTLEEDRLACLDAGMDDYLSKPLELRELDTCIQRWLDVQYS